MTNEHPKPHTDDSNVPPPDAKEDSNLHGSYPPDQLMCVIVESPGFEPGFLDCQSSVLPLDDDPIFLSTASTFGKCSIADLSYPSAVP